MLLTVFGVFHGRGIYHNPDYFFRRPFIMILSFFIISTFFALNVQVQPSSQNFDINISDFWMLWKIYAFVAIVDNFGGCSEVVMLLVIFCPFGIPTLVYESSFLLLSTGVFYGRKYPVVPLLAIA